MSTDTALGLAEVCGADAVRAGGAGDEVGGVRPTWIAAPADTAALAATMRLATEQQLRVVARGEGTKLNWGRPPIAVDILVDTGRLAGIHQHYPDDLVATVGAGTPLRAVQAILGRAGQRLAIDPGSADATIGGVLMTGEAGPLRLGYGAPRDQLIGSEFVRADGQVAHSGGRVVKNVAGYDLGKLLCGSYGTLGIVTSATFRLHPMPAARAWVTCPIGSPMNAHDLVSRLLASPLAPAAIEIDLPRPGTPAATRVDTHRISRPGGSRAAQAEGPGAFGRPIASSGQLAVLLEGTAGGVAARIATAIGMLTPGAVASSAPPPWWGRYPFGPDDVALKLAVPVADLHAALYSLHDATGSPVPIRGSAGVGVCYAALPVRPAGRTAGANGSPVEKIADVLNAVRTTLIARGGTCVVLDAPPAIRDAIDVWGPVSGLDLMRSVKRRFDPDGLLAPGRFVGGI